MLIEEVYRKHNKRTVEWLAHHILVARNTDLDNARDQAWDYVQDAWCQIVGRGLKTGDRFPGLLMTMSKRVWFEAMRQERIRDKNYPLAVVPQPHPYLTPLYRSIADVLTVQRLEVWYLKWIKHFTYQQIADELGLKHNHSASAILSKATTALRKDGIDEEAIRCAQ